MAFLQYTLGQDDANRRLDRILKSFLSKDFPLSEIYKSLRTGKIKINGKKAKPDYRVLENDVLFIEEKLINANVKKSSYSATNSEFKNEILKQVQDDIVGQVRDDIVGQVRDDIVGQDRDDRVGPKLEVIFENKYVKVINKPYDIPVQKAKNELSLDDLIKDSYIPQSDSLSFKPGPLHRLDKKTTGVLFFSNNLKGAQVFSSLMQEHNLTKTYLTVVEGTLKTPQTWTDSIVKNEQPRNLQKTSKTKIDNNGFNTVQIVNAKKNDTSLFEKNATTAETLDKSKVAITKIFPIKTGIYQNKSITFCKVEIITGRTHQIRSQCAFHGFPILGDTAYNKNTKPISSKVEFFLHAYKIEFSQNNELELPPEIIAPLPKNFDNFLKTTCDLTFCKL